MAQGFTTVAGSMASRPEARYSSSRHRPDVGTCLSAAVLTLGLLAAAPLYAQDAFSDKPASTGTQDDSSQAPDATDREEQARRAMDRMFNDPLSGVVVNRTVTVLGKDFYQHFSTLWRQRPESARYSVSIHERPSARFGSEIWVQYRQQPMFHAFLPPARAATREVSEAAVEHVLKNVSRQELERLTTRNPDLGPEEL